MPASSTSRAPPGPGHRRDAPPPPTAVASTTRWCLRPFTFLPVVPPAPPFRRLHQLAVPDGVSGARIGAVRTIRDGGFQAGFASMAFRCVDGGFQPVRSPPIHYTRTVLESTSWTAEQACCATASISRWEPCRPPTCARAEVVEYRRRKPMPIGSGCWNKASSFSVQRAGGIEQASQTSTSRAPSRSWTSAGCTATASSRPMASTTRWCLRPFTFLPPRAGVVPPSLAPFPPSSPTGCQGARCWGRPDLGQQASWMSCQMPCRRQVQK